jgi:hypothetical protein
VRRSTATRHKHILMNLVMKEKCTITAQ